MRPLLALLALILLASQTVAAASDNRPQTATPIQHLVLIMMENHSFDNVFGVYPRINGPVHSSVTSEIQTPTNLLGLPQPWNLSEVQAGTFTTDDPYEGFSEYHADWDNGRMDGFRTSSGPQSMTYFTSAQFSVEWDWAEEYSIGDRYFASYLSNTSPNRLFSLAGFTSVSGDSGPPPSIPANQSIFAELSRYGVSWGYYLPDLEGTPYPLNYFDGISKYSNHFGTVNQFEATMAMKAMPSVSWVMPLGGGLDYSQHPAENVTEGEDWLVGVVDHIMASGYWNSTAIFITYDEGGGYYDQVAPPILDGQQMGFRVPFIVISPYAKEGYVSHTVLNHASELSFIDYNWHLPPLNEYVGDSGLPLDIFEFSSARPPMVLANGTGFPLQPQVPFDSLPYARAGSGNVSLTGLGDENYWVTHNSVVNPIPPAVPELLFLVLVLGAVGLFIGKRRPRKAEEKAALLAAGARAPDEAVVR